MKKPTFCLVLLCVLFLSVGCNSSKNSSGLKDLIVFNYTDNFPASDITLEDLADIEYLPLSMSDGFLLAGSMNNEGGGISITDKNILIRDSDGRSILIYDRSGNPVSKISRYGRGPEEYTYLTQFEVNSKGDEIIIYDSSRKQALFFDIEGKFKRIIPIIERTGRIKLLDDNKILCINHTLDFPYSIISGEDGSLIKDLPIKFPLQHKHDQHGRLAYSNFTNSTRGNMLFDLRTDTIYLVDKKLNVIPAITDNSRYPSNDELYNADNAQLYPTMDTDKYTLFYLLSSPWITPDVKMEFYIYDKKSGQMSKLKQTDSPYDPLALTNGYCNLLSRNRSNTPGIATHMLPADLLINNKEKLKGELLEITNKLKEEDNPVLMIMRFK